MRPFVRLVPSMTEFVLSNTLDIRPWHEVIYDEVFIMAFGPQIIKVADAWLDRNQLLGIDDLFFDLYTHFFHLKCIKIELWKIHTQLCLLENHNREWMQLRNQNL